MEAKIFQDFWEEASRKMTDWKKNEKEKIFESTFLYINTYTIL